jgi:ferrous-iron efflux pump FieF
LLIAAIQSRKKPDEQHMFGHGRAQYVGALVAATLFISFTGLELYREAIPSLWRHSTPKPQNLSLVFAVLIGSMAITAAPLVKLLRTSRRGAAAKAQLLELVNDQLGLVAALAGTAFVALGMPLADPISAIVVATIIVVNGAGLFRENLSMLLGRSPGPQSVARLSQVASKVQGVLRVSEIKAQVLGEDSVEVHLSIEVRPELTIEQAHKIADEVDTAVRSSTDCSYCMVHVNPAVVEAAQPLPRDSVSVQGQG